MQQVQAATGGRKPQALTDVGLCAPVRAGSGSNLVSAGTSVSLADNSAESLAEYRERILAAVAAWDLDSKAAAARAEHRAALDAAADVVRAERLAVDDRERGARLRVAENIRRWPDRVDRWWHDVDRVWLAGQFERAEALNARAVAREAEAAEWAAIVDQLRSAAPTSRLRALASLRAHEATASALWARRRARGLLAPRRDVVAACGEYDARGRWVSARFAEVRCGCGTMRVPVGCGLRALCHQCQKVDLARQRRRLKSAIRGAVEQAQYFHASALERWARAGGAARGPRPLGPGTYFLTFTAESTGDLVRDRDRMQKAWRNVSKWASKTGQWSAYAAVWEATAGTFKERTRTDLAEHGHIHLHVVAISARVDYATCRGVWNRAIEGTGMRDATERHQRFSAPDFSNPAHCAENAAVYLSKYASKGVSVDGFAGEDAGALLNALAHHRRYSTSVGFWNFGTLGRARLPCRDCGEAHELLTAPSGIRTHAPGLVYAATRRALEPPAKSSAAARADVARASRRRRVVANLGYSSVTTA